MKQINYVDITNRVLIDAKFRESTIVGEWKEGQTKLVEIFSGVLTKVHLISSRSPKLEQVLSELCDDKIDKIAFSFDISIIDKIAFSCDISKIDNIAFKISYIQLFSSNGCLIIKNDGSTDKLKMFLADKTRIFVTNKRNLKAMFTLKKGGDNMLKIRSINNGNTLSYIDNKELIFYPWIDKEKISCNAHQILLYAAEVAAYYYGKPNDSASLPSRTKSDNILYLSFRQMLE